MNPDEIKLGRVGHYSWQNACQTASICYVHEPDPNSVNQPMKVNLAGYSHTGDQFRREEVKVGPIEGDEAEFHFNRDCPWNR